VCNGPKGFQTQLTTPHLCDGSRLGWPSGLQRATAEGPKLNMSVQIMTTGNPWQEKGEIVANDKGL